MPQLVVPLASDVDANVTMQHVGNHEFRDVRSPLVTPHALSADRNAPRAAPARTGPPTGRPPVSGCRPWGPIEIGSAVPLGSRTFPAHRGPGGGFVMTVPVVTGPSRRVSADQVRYERRNPAAPGGTG